MKTRIALFALFMLAGYVFAQDGSCPFRPADSYRQASSSPKVASEIVRIFPAAKSVREAKPYLAVYGDEQLLGYVLYSKPASNGITGFAGETPLLIAFSAQKTIVSVQLLANDESPNMVGMILQSPMLKSWNGLTPGEARKKRVDAVSGATYTSNAIIESLRAAVKKL
ncbi:MAG: FMN-binding protein [Bacteroidales bacterium]|nr:FMN-binding protein [Bacteroidales bacterium]